MSWLHDTLAFVPTQKRQKFWIAGSDASVEMAGAHANIKQHRGPVARHQRRIIRSQFGQAGSLAASPVRA
ncbi:MAG: hypothetical protein IIA40_03340 [SAR324 cluster bacterium]|nr:hypothetical protein [SAR324 cluster bacterium]